MSVARQPANSMDLFLWEEITEARAEVERAEDARNTARRRALYAPIGTKKHRDQAFLEATKRALIAEGRLQRLLREAGQ